MPFITSRATQHHIYHILFIEVITNVHPGSKKENLDPNSQRSMSVSYSKRAHRMEYLLYISAKTISHSNTMVKQQIGIWLHQKYQLPTGGRHTVRGYLTHMLQTPELDDLPLIQRKWSFPEPCLLLISLSSEIVAKTFREIHMTEHRADKVQKNEHQLNHLNKSAFLPQCFLGGHP